VFSFEETGGERINRQGIKRRMKEGWIVPRREKGEEEKGEICEGK
jgi:hypothetical protein